MIGKAKIFVLALFSPSKHVPPGYFHLKWYHKCVLVLIRRCKTFKECPMEIRHFEWEKATTKSRIYWNRTKTGLYVIGAAWIGLYLRNREMVEVEKKIEERKRIGAPEIEKYKLGFRTDTYYHKINTEFPKNYKYP